VYILKIKIKQSVYIANLGILDTGAEIDIAENVGESLVKAGYAEVAAKREAITVAETTKVEKVVEEKPKAKRTAKKVKDGE
jgi:pantothenate kinase